MIAKKLTDAISRFSYNKSNCPVPASSFCGCLSPKRIHEVFSPPASDYITASPFIVSSVTDKRGSKYNVGEVVKFLSFVQ